jgi:hypothetical protein
MVRSEAIKKLNSREAKLWYLNVTRWFTFSAQANEISTAKAAKKEVVEKLGHRNWEGDGPADLRIMPWDKGVPSAINFKTQSPVTFLVSRSLE